MKYNVIVTGRLNKNKNKIYYFSTCLLSINPKNYNIQSASQWRSDTFEKQLFSVKKFKNEKRNINTRFDLNEVNNCSESKA